MSRKNKPAILEIFENVVWGSNWQAWLASNPGKKVLPGKSAFFKVALELLHIVSFWKVSEPVSPVSGISFALALTSMGRRPKPWQGMIPCTSILFNDA